MDRTARTEPKPLPDQGRAVRSHTRYAFIVLAAAQVFAGCDRLAPPPDYVYASPDGAESYYIRIRINDGQTRFLVASTAIQVGSFVREFGPDECEYFDAENWECGQSAEDFSGREQFAMRRGVLHWTRFGLTRSMDPRARGSSLPPWSLPVGNPSWGTKAGS